MGKGRIPDRWKEYSNMGQRIPGTRFIAFKVPLKDSILQNLAADEGHFNTRTVMDHISSLGMVIDLTNTDRYYNPKDFTDNRIRHYKVKTAGQVIPNYSVFKRFCHLVENFIEANKDNDKLIGVHCTHGLNRTGYLICRYMIQQLGVAPDQAITDFNSARGYSMEREPYLEDLRKGSWPAVTIHKDDNFDNDDFTHKPRNSRGRGRGGRYVTNYRTRYFKNSTNRNISGH